MLLARYLSWAGLGRVHPNPMVGAAVLRDGRAVGLGWHAEFGGEHAETVAIRDAGELAAGSTLVVTLEPCCHHGKTPPCVEAIIAAGISRVVIGMRDPNPVAEGGIAALLAAGIHVSVGPQQALIRSDNFRYLRALEPTGLPYVAVKLAVSLDGCIADDAGASRWVTGGHAREWVHDLRTQFAAVGAGAATVIADDARLTARGRVTPRIAPTRVIFDRTGRLTLKARIFEDANDVPITVIRGRDSKGGDPLAAPGVTVFEADGLENGLRQLASAGVDSVLIEGGGRLSGALWRQGLVDRVYQIVAPIWLGDGVPAWQDLGHQTIAAASRWTTVERKDLAGDTVIILDRP